MLLCSNEHYYTGYTTDLPRRYQEHLRGDRKCKYTAVFKPIKIAQSWQMENQSQAMRAEYFIKQLTRMQKEKLVQQPETLWALLESKN